MKLALALALPSLSACLVAGAGAGAGGAVYLTSRGAESIVTAPVERVADATERAFVHFGIERTSLAIEDEGKRRELKGEPEDGDPEVTVTLRAEGEGTTKVEARARTGLVTWDKDYARGLIEKIVELATAEAAAPGT